MQYTFNKNKDISSSFIKEDYFPAIVEFSSEELNNHFIEFNFSDTDMFELSVNPKTKELKRFTLTLCNHFTIEGKSLSLPTYEVGGFTISGPDKTECSSFSVKVYNNGLMIETSNEIASKHLRSGHLIFGLSSSDEVTAVYIADLTSDEIAHIKSELNA